MMAAVGFLLGFIIWVTWTLLGVLFALIYLDNYESNSRRDHITFWLFMILGVGYTDWIFGWGILN